MNLTIKHRRLVAQVLVLLWYAIFGGFAVLVTDRLLVLVAPDVDKAPGFTTLRLVVLILSSTVFFVLLVSLDQRARQRDESHLRESEERYQLAIEATNEGLWDWDLRSGEVHFSPRWKAQLGIEDQPFSNAMADWTDRIHAEDRSRVGEELQAHLEGKTDHFESEYRVLHADETYRWMLCRGLAMRDGKGEAYRMAGSQADITERKVSEAQLLRTAFYDPLTQLANRSLLRERLSSCMRRAARRQDFLYALLFLDLDRFKVVNDSLGHLAGDELLVSVASRLDSMLRGGDTVARLGGDEFVMLLEDLKHPGDATRVADRVQESLHQPMIIQGHEVFTTASIGIALSTTGYRDPEAVLRDADIALYRAKAQGKDRYVLFDEEMHQGVLTVMRLESDLRRALDDRGLRVFYQPIVDLPSGKINGFEALVRWPHPTRGWVPPNEFIGLAEETGLITSIDRMVLKQACEQLSRWRSLPECAALSISVNISTRHFMQPELLPLVEDLIATCELVPSQLKLEITESAIMDQPEAAARAFSELRRLGVQLSLDDFGTGYSSLSYLHRFPIQTLKIDRSFVSPLDDHGQESEAEIVRTIIALAHNLGMNVTAEGVEKLGQCHLLRALGCESAQGFYFSPPADADTIEGMLHPPRDLIPSLNLAPVA